MAEKSLCRESLMCPICLDLLQSPVTIPCGHSFCKTCIDYNWKDQRGWYRCPECRKSFHYRPALVKNFMLAGVAEQLKETAPTAADCYAGPQDVNCDMCSGKRKMKAHKSCMQCLVSYCQVHLQPHYDIAVLQKHQLVAPSHTLQENICQEHNEVKKMFCRTDNQLVCVVCCMDQHKEHVTVTASSEKEEKQLRLQDRKAQLNQSIQHIEKELQNLQQEEMRIMDSAERAEAHMEGSAEKVVRCLLIKKRKLKRLIWGERNMELNLVDVQEKQLLRNMSTLKKSISDMDTLMSIQNPCHFLHQYSFQSWLLPPLTPSMSHSPSVYAEAVAQAMSNLSTALNTSIRDFSAPEPEPTNRAGFLSCACDISMDPSTAHTALFLSAENRVVTLRSPAQGPSDHPHSFTHYRQVLSREALSGRCYWEMEWNWKVGVRMALCYGDIERRGHLDDCAFGHNLKSWAVETFDGKFSFWFNKERLELSGRPASRIGVFLDHSAGVVSFYSISHSMTLLHRLQTSFNQPLHVGVWFYWGYHGDTVYFPPIRNNPPKPNTKSATDGN
ncbi:tripartite motif-containing protein 16-like [Eucyclogobius newberryi]|uniref:tripartite motif-containing protein 16-like n=1 Tax=Eucyclogobius newberryi TaxID=166745 RepID=UPI003B5AA481